MIATRLSTVNVSKPCVCILTLRHTSTTKETKSIQAPNPKRISCDMVGPPDSISNIRTIVFKESPCETRLEKKYRVLRAEVQEWNQQFWTEHNSRFFQDRDDYIKKNLPADKQNLTADEMSVFYKSFLDKNWNLHFRYNVEWYKKNYALLKLSIKVKLRRFLRFKD